MRIARRKLLPTFAALMTLTGCAAMGPPRPPSLELPKPPADLRAVRKGDKVVLTWSVPTLTTDHVTVRSLGATRICRGIEPILKECGTAVGEAAPGAIGSPTTSSSASQSPSSSGSSRVPLRPSKSAQKITASYTDALFSGSIHPEMSSFATYAVEVLNAGGRGAGLSNQAHVPLAPTLPPPVALRARLTAKGVVLSWDVPAARIVKSVSNPVSYVYRVYRRTEGEKPTLVGEVPVVDEANVSLTDTDSSIEWEQTYYYHVEPVTVIAGVESAAVAGEHKADERTKGEAGSPNKVEIEGDDSTEVKVFAHDAFPPAVPAELQAVFSGPGQKPAVDLVWAPATDVDLAGYNVYRREGSERAMKIVPTKINAELVKTPAYRDENVAGGKSYLYSVSAVDVRGNESAKSEEAEETVP